MGWGWFLEDCWPSKHKVLGSVLSTVVGEGRQRKVFVVVFFISSHLRNITDSLNTSRRWFVEKQM